MTAKPVFDWQGTTKIESQAHVHAIGMIAVNSALMEEALTRLLIHLLQIEKKIAIVLIHALKIDKRLDLAEKLLDDNKAKMTTDIVDDLRFALQCFSIANENRNTIVHAIYESFDEANDRMAVSKQSRKGNVFKLRWSIGELRAKADEIGNTVNYFSDLLIVLTGGPGTNTLIRRPLLPNMMKLPPPQEAAKGVPSPRQSSP
jgi:hypothetical protein